MNNIIERVREEEEEDFEEAKNNKWVDLWLFITNIINLF